MDETWIYHATLESNRQLAEWTAAGENHPKWPKRQTSAGKVLVCVFWDAQGILFIDYLEKWKTLNSKYYQHYWCFDRRNRQKNVHKWRRKSALSPRRCTVSQVVCNNDKTTWTALRIAFTPTLFSRSGPQWLLAVCRSQKNAPGKEIWLQWRSDIRNWGVFCGKR